jgi:hypothetical protein
LYPNVVFLCLIELVFTFGLQKPNKIKGFLDKDNLIKVCTFQMHFIFHAELLITNDKKASGALACKVCISPGCGRKTRGLSPRLMKFYMISAWFCVHAVVLNDPGRLIAVQKWPWGFEAVALSHICLSGCLFAAAT